MNEDIPAEAKEHAKQNYGADIAIKPIDFVFDDQGPAGLQYLRWWEPSRKGFRNLTAPLLGILRNSKTTAKYCPFKQRTCLHGI